MSGFVPSADISSKARRTEPGLPSNARTAAQTTESQSLASARRTAAEKSAALASGASTVGSDAQTRPRARTVATIWYANVAEFVTRATPGPLGNGCRAAILAISNIADR